MRLCRLETGVWWSTLVGMLCTAMPVAAATPTTFEQFKAAAEYEPRTDTYYVEGDMALQGEKQLRAYWQSQLSRPLRKTGATDSLAINVDSSGLFTGWSEKDRRNLTYCVDNRDAAAHARVVEAMKKASADWMASAGVEFRHVPEQDGNCHSGDGALNPNVMFEVQFKSMRRSATAFFPAAQAPYRKLQLDWARVSEVEAFRNGGDSERRKVVLSLEGILKHELGHVLGFRHEHLNAPYYICGEKKNPDLGIEEFKRLGSEAADMSSVMHYRKGVECVPEEVGVEADYALSDRDRAGARQVYPPSSAPVN